MMGHPSGQTTVEWSLRLKKTVAALLAIVLSVVLASPMTVAAQEDPGALLQAFLETYNAHDVEASLALFADDAVLTEPSWEDMTAVTTLTGHDEIRGWLAPAEGESPDQVTLGEIVVDGDTATAPFEAEIPDMEEFGLSPLVGTVEIVAVDGKIAQFNITYDEEWAGRASEVFAQMMAEWDAESLLQKFADAYNAGDMEAVRAMFAEDAVITEPSMEDPNVIATYTVDEWIAVSSVEGLAGQVTFGEIAVVDAGNASAPFEFANASLEEVGLSPITGTVTIAASEGTITAFDTAFDPEWIAHATEVMAAMATGEGAGEGMGEGEGEATGEGDARGEEMGQGPGELPKTGDAGDSAPLALIAGSLLLIGGMAIRRQQRAA